MGEETKMLEAEIAKSLFEPQDPNAPPTILCRRNTPHRLTYALHDPTWEGLKKTTRHGKTMWEIDRNFNMRIEVNGYCRIPDTKNNRARLELLSKPLVKRATQKKFNFTTLKEEEIEVEIIEKPIYERVQDNLFQKELLSKLAAELRQMGVQAPAEQEGPSYEYAEEGDRPTPADTHVNPIPTVREVIPDNVAAMEQPPEVFGESVTITSEPKRRPGRPRKNE